MPSPPAVARAKDVADAVAAFIADRWAPTAPDAVESTWVARLSFDENDAATLTTGRRVFCIAGDVSLSLLDRSQWKNQYVVGVVVCERYTGASDPPDDWIDARVVWWEQTILYPLSAPGLILAGPAGVVPGVQPDPETPPEVTAFVDRDYLVELKAVFLAVNFAYIDASDFTGAG